MGRGLFRIWLVLTIIWAAFVMFVSSGDTRPRPEVVTMALEAIFVPSGVILIIGLMLRWAFALATMAADTADRNFTVTGEKANPSLKVPPTFGCAIISKFGSRNMGLSCALAWRG